MRTFESQNLRQYLFFINLICSSLLEVKALKNVSRFSRFRSGSKVTEQIGNDLPRSEAYATASNSTAQWTMGAFSVDAKDAGKSFP